MDDFKERVTEALSAFEKVAALAGASCLAGTVEVEYLPRPHKPGGQPSGKMAVYAFFHNGQALKVGKVGLNSDARFRSQHYNPQSSMSNLARSILANPERIGVAGIDSLNIGAWIRQNTDRVNLLLPASIGMPMLSLLESFLHVRWMPMFEGRNGDG